jgi:hypothetical protein
MRGPTASPECPIEQLANVSTGYCGLSLIDWENAEYFAARVCQTKAVRFSAGVSIDHCTGSGPGAGDNLCFVR